MRPTTAPDSAAMCADRPRPIVDRQRPYREGGAMLGRAIAAAGTTEQAVADAIGAAHQRVSEWCLGKRPVDAAVIARLPRAVQVALLTPLLARAKADGDDRPCALTLNARLSENPAGRSWARAIADRRVEASETVGVREAIAQERRDLDALEAQCDVVDRERVIGV